MYVYLKLEGKLDDYKTIGTGKFECNIPLEVPKEVFEKKLRKKKTIMINDCVLKISKIDKIEYSDGAFSDKTSYILPLGVYKKKKTVLQKIKTLYFG